MSNNNESIYDAGEKNEERGEILSPDTTPEKVKDYI